MAMAQSSSDSIVMLYVLLTVSFAKSGEPIKMLFGANLWGHIGTTLPNMMDWSMQQQQCSVSLSLL